MFRHPLLVVPFLVFAITACNLFPDDPTPGVVLEGDAMVEGFTVCIIGDTGEGSPGQYQVAKALEAENCDQIKLLGDVIYPSGIESANDPQIEEKFLNPYEKLIAAGIPISLNMGNHDYKLNPSAWIDFAKQNTSVIFPSLYYLEIYGDVCFFNLESNAYFVKQYSWVKKMKEQYKDQCKVSYSFAHHPRYSVGNHGDAKYAVKLFLNRVVDGKFDAHFGGHDHDLSDEGIVNGTHHFVSGAAAKVRPLKYEPRVWAVSKMGYQTIVYHKNEQGEPYFKFHFHSVDEKSLSNIEHSGTVGHQK